MKKIISFFLAIFFTLISSTLIFAQESSKKILILPFEIYAQQDLLYLKSAIPEMLASRLFIPSKIEIIEFEKVSSLLKESKSLDKAKVQELGISLKADYVIWGSLTVVGDMVSIDAQVLDLSQTKKPVQFYQEIKGLSEIIPQLSRFAKKAKSYIEGKEEDFYKEEVASFYPFLSTFSRAHPERNFYLGSYSPYPGTVAYGLPSPQIQEQKPKITKAKPRFSYDEDESLTKNLVIDLSKPQPVIGWAEEKTSTNASEPVTAVSYNPQPYSYFSKISFQEEKGFLEKIWDSIWPFKKRESYPLSPPPPQTLQSHPPVSTSSSQTFKAQTPVQATPQTIYPSSSQDLKSETLKENPWQWN